MSDCVEIPSLTPGPYPDKVSTQYELYDARDVTNGQPGVPLDLVLTVVNVNDMCAPVHNAKVAIWQCNAIGDYSEYANEVPDGGFGPEYDGTGQTFLRGWQVSDENGVVQFTTIYPGWYFGRATHIHVEIYYSYPAYLDPGAVVTEPLVKITQIAFPEAISAAVYALPSYQHQPFFDRSPDRTPNDVDSVFGWAAPGPFAGDPAQFQHLLLNLSGDPTVRLTGTLTLGIRLASQQKRPSYRFRPEPIPIGDSAPFREPDEAAQMSEVIDDKLREGEATASAEEVIAPEEGRGVR
jgi:protocatechuate 3,4-dioxygenase beta subunit